MLDVMAMGEEYRDDAAAIALLRQTLVDLSENVTAGVVDFDEIDEHLTWIVYVGDIHLFSVGNNRAFHFVSSATAEQLGYDSPDRVRQLGSFTIMNRHYKKLECVYWLRHLVRLPSHRNVEVIDYCARTKVRQASGRVGFEERRYLACNLKDYRGRHDIICVSIEDRNLARQACCFRTATHPDPMIRAATPAIAELASGRRRLEVFVRRSRKQPPARIAERLGISVATVNEHLTRIYEILGFRERKLEQLIELAKRSGLKDSGFGADAPQLAHAY